MCRAGSWSAAGGGNKGARHSSQQLPSIKCQREDRVDCPAPQPKTAFPAQAPSIRPTCSNRWPAHLPTDPANPGSPVTLPTHQLTPSPPDTHSTFPTPPGPTVLTHLRPGVHASHLATPKLTLHPGHLWLYPCAFQQAPPFLTPVCWPVYAAPGPLPKLEPSHMAPTTHPQHWPTTSPLPSDPATRTPTSTSQRYCLHIRLQLRRR